ncbi:MAG TPA: hypothetical protein VI172_14845 [Candidatus Dormibacteraeota bacterium]
MSVYLNLHDQSRVYTSRYNLTDALHIQSGAGTFTVGGPAELGLPGTVADLPEHMSGDFDLMPERTIPAADVASVEDGGVTA